jgi:hypothetical protein
MQTRVEGENDNEGGSGNMAPESGIATEPRFWAHLNRIGQNKDPLEVTEDGV